MKLETIERLSQSFIVFSLFWDLSLLWFNKICKSASVLLSSEHVQNAPWYSHSGDYCYLKANIFMVAYERYFAWLFLKGFPYKKKEGPLCQKPRLNTYNFMLQMEKKSKSLNV